MDTTKEQKIHELRQELEAFLDDWHGAEHAYALSEAYNAANKLRNVEALLQWQPLNDDNQP